MRAGCLVQRTVVSGPIGTRELPCPRRGSNPARSSLEVSKFLGAPRFSPYRTPPLGRHNQTTGVRPAACYLRSAEYVVLFGRQCSGQLCLANALVVTGRGALFTPARRTVLWF